MAHSNPAFTISNGDLRADCNIEIPLSATTIKNKSANRRSIDSRHDYNPHDHTEVEHPTTNWDTLFHLLKGCFGTGILAMPEAFMFAGYIIGSFGTALIGMLCTYAVHLLVNAEYELARRRRVPTLTYQKAAECALEDGPKNLRFLSKYMGTMVNTFVLCNQIGACTAYILFIATNVQAVSDAHWIHLDVRAWMAIALVPLILLSWVRDLKYLAPFSTLATALTLTSFGIILYYVFKDVPSISDRVAIGHVSKYPLFIGTALFSLEAIGVMMPLKNEMKSPRDFGGICGVLNRAMIPIVLLFISLGLFGYLKYGENVQGTITLNLPSDEIPAELVKIMMALSLFVSHGLMNYVSFDIIWIQSLQLKCEARKVSNKLQFFYEYLVRTLLVLAQFTLASIFLNLGLIISLIGAFCLSAIGLAIPAMIHMGTFWHSHRTSSGFYWMLFKDSAVFIFAIFAFVIGTYTSLLNIIRDFQ